MDDRRPVAIRAVSGPGQTVERLLPYGAAQLFELAADVERYPEYLPGWIAVRIRKREAGAYYTEQVVVLGPVRPEFESRVVLRPPERIDVTSDDPGSGRSGCGGSSSPSRAADAG